MRKITLTLFVFCFLLQFLSAQIINGQDTLYGNEWINFDQTYFKIMVAEDGIYKVDYQQLTNAGVPASMIPGNQYQLFHNGEEVPLYTTTDNVFGTSDHLEFYGQKNRSELDRHLFQDPDNEMMNPEYSLFTDTSAYFLTWTDVGGALRYEEVGNDLSNLPGKEGYYMEEMVQEYHTNWSQEGYNYSYASTFNRAEGYSGALKNIQEFTMQPTHAYPAGDQAILEVRFSANGGTHQQQVSLNGNVWKGDNFSNIDLRVLKDGIDNTLLTGAITVKFQGLAGNNDKQRVSNLILTYPREFNAMGQSTFNFTLAPSSGKKYIEVSDFNGNIDQVFVYDLTNGQRIPAQMEGGLAKIAIPPGSSTRKFYLTDTNTNNTPPSIHPVSFIDYAASEADYLILSNKKLFDDGQGVNRVQEYANYRNSVEGGGYSTLIVEVQQLYDQFGWGLNRHNLSIRNFGLYLKKAWQDPADYLFILGKGRIYTSLRTAAQLNNAGNASFYVPTFGNPGSDMLFMAEDEGMAPYLAVGRLPVEVPEEIDIYLRKVKEHDQLINAPSTIRDRSWMKRVIHLGGGGTAGEQSSIRNSLENMAQVIENNQFGAEVHGFYKNSSDPIQISTNDAIFDLINTGVSVITFFGHSGVNTFDFTIDNPSNYQNKGKYPVMFSLGCYIGGIHTATKGVSERFVLNDQGAAIAFIASTGAGYISSLNSYTRNAYSLMGESLYGKSIGQILKGTNEYLESINFGDRYLVHQFTLNGDPALKVSIFEGPDYTVDYGSVKLTPGIVNVTADSFGVVFDVVNIGKNIEDSISIKIEQQFPDGTTIVPFIKKIEAPSFRSTLDVKIPTYGRMSLGLNKLFISVDVEQEVDELPAAQAELNNELTSFAGEKGFRFFIQDNGAEIVYPPEFAIVNEPTVTLSASTLNSLVAEDGYIMELDTTELFNSQGKLQNELVQGGGLLKWAPDIDWKDGQVYYWRVSPDSVSTDLGYSWVNSSFVYLPGSEEGWNQSDYWQLKKNDFNNTEISSTTKNIEFVDNFLDIRILNKVWDPSNPPIYQNNQNNINSPWTWSIHEGLNVAVLDSTTLEYWRNPYGGLYGSINTAGGWTSVVPFAYKTDNLTDRQSLINFLENIVPAGNYVIIYSAHRTLSADYHAEDWALDSLDLNGKNIFNVLESQGVMNMRELEGKESVPLVIAYKKDDGLIFEGYAENKNESIEFQHAFQGFWYEGNLESTIIGPANYWSWFLNGFIQNSINDSDTVNFIIKGLDKERTQETVLFENFNEEMLDLSGVDPLEYPYLKIGLNIKDEVARTAPHLDYWRVLYEGVPEVAVNPNAYFLKLSDTLQQGASFKLGYNIENLSNLGMDSLLIKYSIINANNGAETIYTRIGQVPKKTSQDIEFEFNTGNLEGRQSVVVELNPDEDQRELSHINNFINTDFSVETDVRNPLVDVTFDGVHILDGDIVSPKPNIAVAITDENRFLALKDTSLFKLFIRYPGRESIENITFSSSQVLFHPASADNLEKENKAVIEYNPILLEDGKYELIVQAEDVSGNQSGAFDFKISFEVINKRMISNLLNYPNPFSTSTHFVYTLTGEEPPKDYKIQIMTISGRVVKEISKEELGLLRIGTHKTDYVWDGRDNYGDQLATGVYLYRFIIKNEEGSEYEHFGNEKVDGFFKNNYGKMVRIR